MSPRRGLIQDIESEQVVIISPVTLKILYVDFVITLEFSSYAALTCIQFLVAVYKAASSLLVIQMIMSVKLESTKELDVLLVVK